MCGTGHTKDGWGNMPLCSVWTCVHIQAVLPEPWVSQTSRPLWVPLPRLEAAATVVPAAPGGPRGEESQSSGVPGTGQVAGRSPHVALSS